ncbi:MAG TPA: tetratricopeptide repeat protein [Candidatus Dormibacteraeota bacterium]|nr:tetratricopeptide repeat protein [Candidatus Dormibacteraeota bacterium]
MPRSLAIFVSLSFMGVVFVGLTMGMVYRLAPEHRTSPTLRWLLVWGAKGFLAPIMLWVFLNLGISWAVQPFMPSVQAAQLSGGPWIVEFLRAQGEGLFIVGSFWAALTLGLSIWQAGRGLEGEARSDFRALCWTCLAAMILPAVGIYALGGLPVAGLAVLAILVPIGGYAPSITSKVQIPPMYAKAIAKMKFGKYSEAEWDIIQELEKREDDFEGWMMLAELYANQFHDLPEAEQTILEICDQPRTAPSQMSIALHRLADWHLSMGNDPDAARRALRIVSDRLPYTHLAHMAEVRSNQLPKTSEDLHETKMHMPIPLPALGDQLDDQTPPQPTMSRKEAAAAANDCVEKLKRDPNHIGARERLARLFAEQLGNADRGIEQIDLLLNVADQPQMKRAEWLGLTAAWHLKHRQDPESARKILERIINEFPGTPQELAAKRRIRLIDTEQLSTPGV